MSKNYKYLFLFLLLLTGLAFFIYKKNNVKSSMTDSSRDFGIENTDKIGKIFVTDRSHLGYTLEKRNGVWFADSIHPADIEFVNILLTTIRKMSVTNLVPKTAIPNIMKDVATIGKKVEIYDLDGKKLKSFYIGATNQRVNGVFMVLEGYNIPYEMGITGFNGNIGGRFWPLNLIDVRSKQLFKYQAGQIKSIEITYPRDKDESFTLNIEGNSKYKVFPISTTRKVINREVSKGLTERFLSNFEDIRAAYVIRDNMLGADTLVSTVPFASYKILDKDNITKTVDFYPVLNGENRIGLGYEPETFYAVVNNKNYYTAQNSVLKKIFWGYSYFYEK